MGSCLLFLISLLGADEPAARLPVPDEQAQKAALVVVREAYKADFDKSKTSEEKATLAKKLIEEAEATKGDDAGRYVLLRVARDIAAQSGDYSTAASAVEQMAAVYTVDELQTKADTAAVVAKAIHSSQAQLELALAVGSVVEDAVASDRYQIAKPMASLALSCAQKGRDAGTVKRLLARKNEIELLATEFPKIRDALTLLETMPSDATANLAVGRFYCLRKGQWENGLPYLAEASDGPLKSAAVLELSDEQDALKIGDGWWEYGEGQKGLVREHVRRHAAYWYDKAFSGLSGLAKAKVQKRLEEAKASPQTGSDKKSASRDIESKQKLSSKRSKNQSELEKWKDWTPLASDLDTFRRYWRPGDDRGNVYFDAATRTIQVDSLYNFGSVEVNQAWAEFYFEIEFRSLVENQFDLKINGVTLKIGPTLSRFAPGTMVRVFYDADSKVATALVADQVASRATVVDDKWTSRFHCEFVAHYEAKLQLRALMLLPASAKKKADDNDSNANKLKRSSNSRQKAASLAEQLKNSRWLNTNGFTFEWDGNGIVCHCKDGNRNPVPCVYLGPYTASVQFEGVLGMPVHTLVFNEEFDAFEQVMDGRVTTTSRRLK